MADKTYLKSALTICAVLFLLAHLTFAAPPRYEIIDLGTLSGYSASTARSINGHGQIVGHVGQSWPDFRAVLFDMTGNGNNIDLGTLGGSRGMAFSINDSGQIVGDSENSSGQLLATLFDQTGSGSNRDLGTLGGGWSGAYAINNNGQPVGTSDNSSANRHAILFDPSDSSNNIDLGTLPGGDWSGAYSISDNAKVVGWATNISGDYRAVLLDSTGDGNNIDLGTLGGNGSTAYSINDSGQIVGLAKNTSDDWRATLFHPTGNGNNINLGSLGGSESWAYSINDTGQIVGWAETALSQRCATLFDPTGNGNNIDLNTLIGPDSGWFLEEARSINEQGWIVGKGRNPAGENHAFLIIPIPPKIIDVDDDAGGANDGSSWEDAFNYLQDALAAAWPGDEIHVAQGIYTPDSNSADPNGSGDREATFQLINGVTIKGGYAGAGTPDPNARDIQLYETILSGDLDGNDGLNFTNNDENSYHVVSGSGTDETAALDGITITGGNANEDYKTIPIHAKGGGMFSESGSPTLTQCTFRGNSAYAGGGMYNLKYSNPRLSNCTFSENSASGNGGGMFNSQSSPTLVNCTFSDGYAYNTGGGAFNSGGSPTFTNCEFTENTAGSGGGVCNADSNTVIINCVFGANSAVATATTVGQGGGMANFYNNSVVVNCTFSDNSAKHGGGGMVNYLGNLMVTNCTFSSNYGGGMDNYSSSPMITNCIFSGNYCTIMINFESSPILTNCTLNGNSTSWTGAGIYNYYYSQPTITNCVLWNDGNEIWNTDYSTVTITYSNVEGGWSGEGNIDSEPLFVDPGYWDPNGTPADVNDDVWIEGDYHLMSDSPCIDAGDPNYIAEPNETDLDGNPRVICGRIDMGAYEFNPPIPAEVDIDPNTLNLNSKGRWITAFIWFPEEYYVTDIEPDSVLLAGEIKPERFWLSEDNQIAIAKFDREQVQAILEAGDIELTITGQLTDDTPFEAKDIIKVIERGGEK